MKAADFITVAKNAGFTGSALIKALAIAIAESGLNPDAIGDKNLTNEIWGVSVGLMQVRTIKNPKQAEQFRSVIFSNRLRDPAYNLSAAYLISKKGTDFNAWSTYKNNSYLKYTKAAAIAVNEATGSNPGILSALAIGFSIALISK